MDHSPQLSSAVSNGPASAQAAEPAQGVVHLPDQLVFAVAAGADGKPADTFSTRVVGKALRLAFQPKEGAKLPDSIADRARLIRSAIHAASDAIRTQPAERRAGGATVVVLLFHPTDRKRAMLLNVGDCRCYRFRNGRPELLTRAPSAADSADETPLLLDVLNNVIGGNERAEIDEQFIPVEPGDAFALIPGVLFPDKPDIMVGRALRKSSSEPISAKAQALVDEAAKAGTKGGMAVVVQIEAVKPVAEPVPVAPPPAPEPVVAPPSVVEIPPAPAPAPIVETPEPESETPAPVVEQVVEVPASLVQPVPPVAAEPVALAEVVAEPPPEQSLPVEVPEPEPLTAPAPVAKPAARKTPRKAVPPVGDLSPEPLMPQAPVAVAKPVAAAAPSIPAVPSVPTNPAPQRSASPLARKTLLHTAPVVPKPAAKLKLPPMLIPITLAAVAVLVVLGLGYLGYRWLSHRGGGDAERELQAGAAAASSVHEARLSGRWDVLEKKLSKLPPMPPGDEAVVRAWIALWHKAAAEDFTDMQARSHLDALDALVRLAGGRPVATPAQWSSRDRADVYCRKVAEKQQALAEAVQQSLAALNQRGDIPFEDHAAQQAVLAGVGRFTRGRLNARLDALRGDFAVIRTDEGQLNNWIDSGAAAMPLDEIALQQKPGEPLRRMQAGLDRAWEDLFETINGMSADITYWRGRRIPADLLTRMNRLEAVRLNIVSDRRKYGDIQKWRLNSGSKPLVKWLLAEAAAIGTQLPAATTQPAPAARRR